MVSKLALSALAVALLVGMTSVAPAQTQPAPGASSEGNVGPGATNTRMKSHHATNTGMKSHKMKTSKIKSGTTTGMSRKPSGQQNANPGTENRSGGKY
jgi:hypothetical protein